MGAEALRENLTGMANTATGFWALLANTTGRNNTANGNSALERNTTGQENTAVGSWALKENGRGGGNTAIGTEALFASVDQFENTAIGLRALRGFNWDGADGYRQLGSENTAIGANAMAGNDTGSNNTAVGHRALQSGGNTGSFNTASGGNALIGNLSGDGNTATGYDSLHSNMSGFRNTASGVSALGSVTTGVRNTAIGASAGKNLVTGSDNIFIGAENVGGAAVNGVTRIGSKSHQKKAFIAGIRGVKTGLSDALPVYIDANGQLGTIKSSREFKRDIQPMGNISENLLALHPVTFRYKELDEDGKRPMQFGLVAEEVAEVFPELVIYDENGKPDTVKYDLIVTMLLNEFQKERSATQAELARLKSEMARMAGIIERLDLEMRMASTR